MMYSFLTGFWQQSVLRSLARYKKLEHIIKILLIFFVYLPRYKIVIPAHHLYIQTKIKTLKASFFQMTVTVFEFTTN